MLLDQLIPLLLREVALRMPDPSGMAGAFAAAWLAVTDETFALEWFNRWHPIITPHRPWQYAFITWKRIQPKGGAPEQLARLMLQYLQWQKQQQKLQQQLTHLCLTDAAAQQRAASTCPAQASAAAAAAGEGAASHLQAQQATPHAQQQAANSAAAGTEPLIRPTFAFEATTTSFSRCQPLPSAIRRASKLASQGQGVAALFMLCPASSTLLLPYAVKARNAELVHQILSAQPALQQGRPQDAVYPTNYVAFSNFFTMLPTIRVAGYAALKAGCSEILTTLLATRKNASNHLAGPLLRYAAGHSNAACVQQLLVYAAMEQAIQPHPHHLAVAAARSDSWAAAVVELLLQYLPIKQRSAKWLKATYTAACTSGSAAVLKVLLQHAAAAPGVQQQQQHVAALLEACGRSGNSYLWEQMLGGQNQQPSTADSSGSSSSSSSTYSTDNTVVYDQQHQEMLGQDQRQMQQQLLQPLQAVTLTPQQWTDILHAVLPCSTPQYNSSTPQQQHHERSSRLCMADQLWHRIQLAGQATVVQQAVLTYEHRYGVLLPNEHACQLLCMTFEKDDNNDPCQINVRSQMLPERLWWLQMHGMLHEDLGGGLMRNAWFWVRNAWFAGDHLRALQIYCKWEQCNAACPAAEQASEQQAEATGDKAAADSAEGPSVTAATAQQDTDAASVASEGPAAAAAAAAAEQSPAVAVDPTLDSAVTAFDQAAAAVFAAAGSAQSVAAEPQASAVDAHMTAAAVATTDCQTTAAATTAQTAAATQGILTDQETESQDRQDAVDLLLSSRLNTAVAAGDVAAITQLVSFTALANVVTATPEFDRLAAHLPTIQWLETSKLCTAGDVAALGEQLGVDCANLIQAALGRQAGLSVDNVQTASETAACGAASQQLEPMPLWQLALLQVLSGTTSARPGFDFSGSCSVMHLDDVVSRGAGVEQFQKLSDAGLLCIAQYSRPTYSFGVHAVGQPLAEAAVAEVQPDLLSWVLQPQQRHLWGTSGQSRGDFMRRLLVPYSKGNPIDCKGRRNWYSLEQQEKQQYAQYQQQIWGTLPAPGVTAKQHVPAVVQPAVDLAMLLLQQEHEAAEAQCLCSHWVTKFVRAGSCELTLLRAKAILAAVAASAGIPWGARSMHRAAVRQAVATGDVDLLAMLLLWGARLPFSSEPAANHDADEEWW